MKQLCLLGVFLLLGSTVLAADKNPAADNPAQIQARVLDGSGHFEQAGDLELWISQAVAKKGSPLAKPYTGWIALNGDFQRLYTSKQGGFIIDGKVTEQDGKYEVEIDACAGFSLDKKVTLKSGERKSHKVD